MYHPLRADKGLISVPADFKKLRYQYLVRGETMVFGQPHSQHYYSLLMFCIDAYCVTAQFLRLHIFTCISSEQ